MEILETGGLNNELPCPVECYILVYSINSRDSFRIIPELYDRLKLANHACTQDLSGIHPLVLPQKPVPQILLVANKIDQTRERLVSTKAETLPKD